MSTSRAQANQSLYYARILSGSWRKELAQQDIPKSILEQAFAPGIRAQLRRAYGWFLLEVSAPAVMPLDPPQRCADLPAVGEGESLSAEIAEFALLERAGWLAEMLAISSAAQVVPTVTASTHNLAQCANEYAVTPDLVDLWHDNLQAIFHRMSDSLDEC